MTTVTSGMGQGPPGPAGATGATGAQGPQGVAGAGTRTANGVTITAVNLGLSTLLTGTELHVLAVMPT